MFCKYCGKTLKKDTEQCMYCKNSSVPTEAYKIADIDIANIIGLSSVTVMNGNEKEPEVYNTINETAVQVSQSQPVSDLCTVTQTKRVSHRKNRRYILYRVVILLCAIMIIACVCFIGALLFGNNGGTPSEVTTEVTTEAVIPTALEIAEDIPAEKYTLTVKYGIDETNTGSYAAGDEVSITANDPVGGMQFDKWTVTTGEGKFTDENSVNTIFTMGHSDATVTAEYKPIE